MEIKISTPMFGDVTVKDVMIDTEFNMLEEGISVISESGDFENFDLVGYSVDDIKSALKEDRNYLDNLITENN